MTPIPDRWALLDPDDYETTCPECDVELQLGHDAECGTPDAQALRIRQLEAEIEALDKALGDANRAKDLWRTRALTAEHKLEADQGALADWEAKFNHTWERAAELECQVREQDARIQARDDSVVMLDEMSYGEAISTVERHYSEPEL